MTFNLPNSVDDIPDWIPTKCEALIYGYADDINNVDTLFVPIYKSDINNMLDNTLMLEFIIPGKYIITPPLQGYSKYKIQNKNRNYISILTENNDAGGKSFLQICNKLWIVTTSNITYNNCIIHHIEYICDIN